MSNTPITSMVSGGAILGSTSTTDDEAKGNEDTVEMDLREVGAVN